MDEETRAQMESLMPENHVRSGRVLSPEEEEEYYQEEETQPPAVKFLVDWGLRPFVAGVSLAIGMSIGYAVFDNVLCLGFIRRHRD